MRIPYERVEPCLLGSQTITMDLTDKTVVTRDKRKVGRVELKTSLSVVVDALGGSLDELDVLEVRIVPPPTKK